MNVLFFIFIGLISSGTNGQSCHSKFNESLTGKCISIDECQGTVLGVSSCQEHRCCVSPSFTSNSTVSCLFSNDFDILFNTTRGKFLQTVLNLGINEANICTNCYAKAAFLAISAAMTNNFRNDEATGDDAQFSSDDNKYGNNQTNDGSRFRRRGFFGLRGRLMYERLQKSMPQYQSLSKPGIVALVENSIMIAAKLWNYPDLINASNLTDYADGSFYGFSMIWYKLTGDIENLAVAAKYYSTFLRQLQCDGDLYPGQGPICQFNATHNGSCSPDCIKGLDDSSTICGCSDPKGSQCPNSPRHIRCCLDTCSQELKMDLGIVIDASGSITSPNYELQRTFTKDLLRRVNIGQNKTHVTIINFSTNVSVLTWLNKDYTLNEKLKKIDEAKYLAQDTNTHLALEEVNKVFTKTNGRRSVQEGVPSVIFVITDGQSNLPNETIQAANSVKNNQIIIVSVGVGSGTDITELHGICTPPATENSFLISNYAALDQKLNKFTSRSCSEPAVVPANSTVITDVSKNKYKFFKVTILIIGNRFKIVVKEFFGNVKVFYSFTNRNPKDPEDFIDYITKTKSINQQKSLIIDRSDNKTNFIYIGVKGLDEQNQFEIKLEDCEKVICKSKGTMMKLNFILFFMIIILFF